MTNKTTQSLINDNTYNGKKIAILIPCYNEELTIKKVINDFQKQLPEANIYVYDNNSTDNTYKIAMDEGAVVRKVKKQGKGFVVSAMFEDVDADVYVLVDGDDTYPSEKVHDLIKPIINESADMVVGNRLKEYSDRSFVFMNLLGNHLVVKTINIIFKCKLHDIMSGYRVFNKSFVKKNTNYF